MASQPYKMVLMYTILDGTIPSCTAPNLILIPMPFNYQNVFLVQHYSLPFGDCKLDTLDLRKIESAPKYIGNTQVWQFDWI